MNRAILFLWIVAVLFPGCVEPYTPEIRESQESLVVEGMLTDQPGLQTISLSRSSPFNDPGFVPESNCQVCVVDENGNIFWFQNQGKGIYQLWMTASRLVRGTAYKLSIETNEGKEYESDYQILPPQCPSIDSVYYEIQTVETSDPEQSLEGIQFYIDLDAEDDQVRNYRWELSETWEYHSYHFIQYIFDGSLITLSDPYIYYYCWRTEKIYDILTLSTKNLISNRIAKYPLHFVTNQTDRLKVKYSLLVRQYSLTDDAFQYWDQMRKLQQESGGLYEVQPPQIRGNVYNMNDPDEVVLGFFSVSSLTEKRIFVDVHREFLFPQVEMCMKERLVTISSLDEIPGNYYLPVYMISFAQRGSGPPYGVGPRECFNCTLKGGTNVKPYFWE